MKLTIISMKYFLNKIKSYDEIGSIFLGGIPMIADDMMSFIKNDIVVFGIGVLLFIIVTGNSVYGICKHT